MKVVLNRNDEGKVTGYTMHKEDDADADTIEIIRDMYFWRSQGEPLYDGRKSADKSDDTIALTFTMKKIKKLKDAYFRYVNEQRFAKMPAKPYPEWESKYGSQVLSETKRKPSDVIKQPVYIYYSGQGTQEYFTAKDDATATDFITEQKKLTKHSSCYKTIVEIPATGTYWMYQGINLMNENNLIKHLREEATNGTDQSNQL